MDIFNECSALTFVATMPCPWQVSHTRTPLPSPEAISVVRGHQENTQERSENLKVRNAYRTLYNDCRRPGALCTIGPPLVVFQDKMMLAQQALQQPILYSV